MDKKEHVEKFKKYEAEMKEYLIAKYFSDNTLDGKDGQANPENRLPSYELLQDHKTFLELIRKKPSSSGESATSGNSKEKPSA